MKRAVSLLMAVTVLLTSCGTSAGAGAEAGQQFKTLYSAEVETLNYLDATSELEMTIAANIVDSLVEYDTLGNVQPALATEWKTSDDGLVWTFTIRPDVPWVDSEGNKTDYHVTAQDFVDSIAWVLDSNNAAQNQFFLNGIIKNAEAYFDGTVTDFNEVGVKAIDEYTLEYTLEKPVPYFLTMLTYTVFLPVNGTFLAEQGANFGTTNTSMLYNGGYTLKEFAPSERHVLSKNNEYWDAENIHITEIVETYNAEANTLAPELFLRGETQQAKINSDILEDWKNDPEKSKILRPSLNGTYSYFYALNFDPQFDAAFEPENWKVAVNNLAFRKSLFHGMDRIQPMTVEEPFEPASRLLNTITPPSFILNEGVDYTQYGDLAEISATDSYNVDLALQFKEQAMTELEGKVTFPVKVLMPYNSGQPDWAKRAQVVEQQMEAALGTDYIDIVLEAGPSTGFLSEVRRPGKYALMEVNWGPDYADPETYTDPFYDGGSYNKPEFVEGYTDANGKKTYTNLVDAAKNETMDVNARYEKFAEAEAFLIENAFVIPYAVNNPGYKASYLNPFEAQYAPFGLCYLKYKGQSILEQPMNTDEFNEQKAAWEAQR